MKPSEIRALSDKELVEKLDELKTELFNLRFQHAINQLDNPVRIKEVKRDIARTLTVIRAKELESAKSQREAE